MNNFEIIRNDILLDFIELAAFGRIPINDKEYNRLYDDLVTKLDDLYEYIELLDRGIVRL